MRSPLDAGAGRRVADLLHEGGEAARPGGRRRQGAAHLLHAAAQLVDAELVHHPLQAGAQLVVAVARLVEDTQHRLDRRHQVLAGGEVLERQRLRADPDRLVSLLTADPEQHFASLLTRGFAAVDAAQDEAEAMRQLRLMKAEAALLIALADIGGVWPLQKVTRALTDLADTAVRSAVRFLLRDAAARGKLEPRNRNQPEQGSGYVVVAMGKMGAFELNYSSDIDLIVFFDPNAPSINRDTMPRSSMCGSRAGW